MSVGDFNIGFNLVLDGLSLTMLSRGHWCGFPYSTRTRLSLYMRAVKRATLASLPTPTRSSPAPAVWVLAQNPLLMYLGWQGVPASESADRFLLHPDPNKSASGMKAFVVTRVGDVFLAFALFILYNELGTLNFREMVDVIAHFAYGARTC